MPPFPSPDSSPSAPHKCTLPAALPMSLVLFGTSSPCASGQGTGCGAALQSGAASSQTGLKVLLLQLTLVWIAPSVMMSV